MKTQVISKKLALGMGVFLLASCSTTGLKKAEPKWVPIERIEKVVWADDSSEVAVVVSHLEEKISGWLNKTTEKRNLNYQVFVQEINGNEKRPITELRDTPVGQIFFMKRAGYLVIESLLKDGGQSFDKMDMQGHEMLIVETSKEVCPVQKAAAGSKPFPAVYHTVIPSPDGKQLAHVYSPECGKVTIDFLDADSLTVVDGQTFDIDEPTDVTWHRDGYIIFATVKLDKAWKVAVQESPVPIQPPKCLSPKTTSSSVSTGGRLVYPDETGKLAMKRVEQKQIFGCQ